MALVGLAIKLALMNGTRVFPPVRFVAPGFLDFPLAIRIVPANDLIDFGAAWNAFLATTLRLGLASNITNAVMVKRYFIELHFVSAKYSTPPYLAQRWRKKAQEPYSEVFHRALQLDNSALIKAPQQTLRMTSRSAVRSPHTCFAV
jgi:hypothetical protein